MGGMSCRALWQTLHDPTRLRLLERLQEEDLSWAERMRRHGDWVDRHRQFHEALVAACDDRWLLRLRSLMFYQLERYRFLSKMNREKSPTRQGTEHRTIMEAAVARDAQKATTLLERHIRETSDSILGTLA